MCEKFGEVSNFCKPLSEVNSGGVQQKHGYRGDKSVNFFGDSSE